MSNPITEIISDFAKSQSRNKIIFHQDTIPDIMSVNIGVVLSERICNIKDAGKLPMRVSMDLEKLLNRNILHHDVYGKYLGIKNLGILFERELKLDFFRLLDNFSQNNLLFIQWEGEIDTDNLYFLTKEEGIKINIRNLSHIVI